jgi:hypothetical protein
MYATCITKTHHYPPAYLEDGDEVPEPQKTFTSRCGSLSENISLKCGVLMRYHNGMASIQIDSALF